VSNTIKRTTLIVRDIEKSARWYEHVLGMARYYDKEIVLSGIGLAAGKSGDRTRLIIMQGSHPEIGMIGLLQWLEPEMPAPPDIPASVGFGNPIFVVATDDCREACRRARESGTRIHAEPHEWSVEGADSSTKHFVAVSLFDPDGYFYELNQLVMSEQRSD